MSGVVFLRGYVKRVESGSSVCSNNSWWLFWSLVVVFEGPWIILSRGVLLRSTAQ